MKTVYCNQCGEAVQFTPSKFSSSTPATCKKCNKHLQILTCEKCGHSFLFSGVRKAPTIFIYCEKCEYCIEATSDYGFGPTMPAMIFKGSRMLAFVKGARTFLDANNNKLDIKIPLGAKRESLYTRIFSICQDVAQAIMDKEKAEKGDDLI